MIDNRATHPTPEGIELSLTPAGIVPRAGAWLIDFLIRMLIMMVASFLVIMEEAGMGIMLVIYFLVDWFYSVFFEVFKNGQTIGKRSFEIAVVMDSGMPIGWQASMIRNLLRVADFLPFMFFAGILTSLINGQNKRLGDIVAGTMVVHLPKIQATFDIKAAAPIDLPMLLTVKEQQAILSFAERMEGLPAGRRDELTELLFDMTKTKNPNRANQTVLGYANAIIGQATYDNHPQS